MDPNDCLRLIRLAVERIERIEDGDDYAGRKEELAHLAGTMAHLAKSIDGWMASGGFLPSAWSKNRGQR